jgi:hypothetical protein
MTSKLQWRSTIVAFMALLALTPYSAARTASASDTHAASAQAGSETHRCRSFSSSVSGCPALLMSKSIRPSPHRSPLSGFVPLGPVAGDRLSRPPTQSKLPRANRIRTYQTEPAPGRLSHDAPVRVRCCKGGKVANHLRTTHAQSCTICPSGHSTRTARPIMVSSA